MMGKDLTPASSSISRTAQTAGVSPASSEPFGRTHFDRSDDAVTRRHSKPARRRRTTTPPLRSRDRMGVGVEVVTSREACVVDMKAR
jgi:hypothetical protein